MIIWARLEGFEELKKVLALPIRFPFSSYMYEDESQDDKQHPDDAIFIRRVTDQETKPK